MQTKHKASPAFDTLSLGALAPELAKYQQEPPQMASGAVGKHGYLRLRFADRGAKSTLHEMERKVPLLVQKALYWDEEMPFLPCVPMISTSGCVLQGDRLTVEIEVDAGACAHSRLILNLCRIRSFRIVIRDLSAIPLLNATAPPPCFIRKS